MHTTKTSKTTSRLKRLKFYCNICLMRIGNNGIKGKLLTSCQHIICDTCYVATIAAAANCKRCPKCKMREIAALPFDGHFSLPAYVQQQFFFDAEPQIKQAIETIAFQHNHMQVNEILQMLERRKLAEDMKVALARQRELAIWNRLYTTRAYEYGMALRRNYKHLTLLKANKADREIIIAALKQTKLMIVQLEKFLAVNPIPNDAELAAFTRKQRQKNLKQKTD